MPCHAEMRRGARTGNGAGKESGLRRHKRRGGGGGGTHGARALHRGHGHFKISAAVNLVALAAVLGAATFRRQQGGQLGFLVRAMMQRGAERHPGIAEEAEAQQRQQQKLQHL